MVAVFADRRPSRKQRPHRAEVVAAGAVLCGAGGNNPHSPIGLMFGRGEFGDHGAGLVLVQQTEPHRHRGQHAGLVHLLVLLIESKSKPVFLRRPESFVHQRLLAREIFAQLLADVFLSRQDAPGWRALAKPPPPARSGKAQYGPAAAGRLPPSRDRCRNSAAAPAHRKWKAEIDTPSTGCPTSAGQMPRRRSPPRNRSWR